MTDQLSWVHYALWMQTTLGQRSITARGLLSGGRMSGHPSCCVSNVSVVGENYTAPSLPVAIIGILSGAELWQNRATTAAAVMWRGYWEEGSATGWRTAGWRAAYDICCTDEADADAGDVAATVIHTVQQCRSPHLSTTAGMMSQKQRRLNLRLVMSSVVPV